ncbi:hypothetical protein CISG_01256 [Coccidioides immitis RMSCC 3703]|uniref:Uncharacterized protein n=1 Tax=Coccidioides immitis RMSCC 3703 TaxID=454286 RepID=A0A0J8QYR3_COCIT|nr:hypothetical protein CISG_01256 [Coccidioides immitis RMSCC 3703]
MDNHFHQHLKAVNRGGNTAESDDNIGVLHAPLRQCKTCLISTTGEEKRKYFFFGGAESGVTAYYSSTNAQYKELLLGLSFVFDEAHFAGPTWDEIFWGS